MSRVKVTTIRSVHIGNGIFLQNNSDFVIDNDNIFIINPKKVLDIIGVERLDAWVSAIERRENIKDFLSRIGNRNNPESYSSRKINNYSSIKKDKTLKECIHDGRGYPYIPGSSIKGAIRTALLASIINKNPNRYTLQDVINIQGRMSASNLEQKIFGGIQDSLFKYLIVGDAFFEKGSEIAIDAVNLNITTKDDLYDKSKLQSLEVICNDNEAECHITLALDKHRLALKEKSVKTLPEEMQSLSSIFKTVNQHTKKLLEEDIKFWEEISEDKNGADEYIDSLKGIIEDIDACEVGKECILKLGHASGWRFTTGAWTEQYEWFDTHVVPASRPNNRFYQDYDFPKTRRIEENNDVLGFIKLSIID